MSDQSKPHPHPDIAAADRVRAEDDVRTFQRQEELADQQAQAAETMEDDQRLLFENAERLSSVHADVHQRSGEIAEKAREIQPPEV